MAEKMKLTEKWAEVLNEGDAVHESKQEAIAVMLENQAEQGKKLHEGETTNVTSGIQNWDPVLVSMIRRAAPKLIAFDIAGVQPMTMPSGLIFTLKARYDSQAGTEALFNEANTAQSGTGTHAGSIFGGDDLYNNTTGAPGADTVVDGTQLSTGTGMATSVAETLGVAGSGVDFKEMGISVEKYSISAKSRALKAEYSVELEQDLMAVHGLSAETELTNLLTQEITQEINRELLRTMYFLAKLGAQNTTNPGIFDVQADANGRWSVERFKGLLFQIELERNAIAKQTRRGKGNFLVVSSNVASAFAMTGMLDNRGTKLDNGLVVDETGATFAGVMNGMRVYIDPYTVEDFALVGYNGPSAWDSGIVYSPYVPLTLMKVQHEHSFQPVIGFKTRYALSKTPLEHGSATIDYATDYRTSPFYRIIKIDNLF